MIGSIFGFSSVMGLRKKVETPVKRLGPFRFPLCHGHTGHFQQEPPICCVNIFAWESRTSARR
jgi:hypothetical protein